MENLKEKFETEKRTVERGHKQPRTRQNPTIGKRRYNQNDPNRSSRPLKRRKHRGNSNGEEKSRKANDKTKPKEKGNKRGGPENN